MKKYPKQSDQKLDMIITIADLARYLKLSEKTILKLSKEGKIPGIKIASQWRFYLPAIERWLEEMQRKNYDTKQFSTMDTFS